MLECRRDRSLKSRIGPRIISLIKNLKNDILHCSNTNKTAWFRNSYFKRSKLNLGFLIS